MVALFAALIVPWFINWNDYRSAFEVEAEKILGHPVHVNGMATAAILPSPSLTFTDVTVGDFDGTPLMTVQRFSVTIELVPLLQGEIHVVGMRLEQPELKLALDEHGQAEWLRRSEASRGLDPSRVVLEDVEIAGGRLIYSDARGGVSQTVEGVSATIEARSLLGPWRVEGSYLAGGQQIPFHAVTGIRLADGSIRVKADFTPPGLPLAISADGVAAAAADGPAYRGTYNVTEISSGDKPEAGAIGWRSDGMFALTPAGLTVSDATIATGPPEKPTNVNGSGTLQFGKTASFTAALQARQLDLDRALGGGPTDPVNVGRAEGQLVDVLKHLPTLSIPGSVSFTVPGIVVGASLIQDVNLAASASSAGWSIDGFHAKLPGQATVDVSAKLASGPAFGMKGTAHLAVAQPAAFATWLRGRAQDAGRLLPAFDLAGTIDIGETRIAVDKATAKIGPATISGSFWWEVAKGQRTLGTELAADRIDFDAAKSVADLLIAGNWADTTALADSFQIVLSAGLLTYQDFTFKDVAVDAAYTDDTLTVTKVAAGYDGGSLNINGRLDAVKTAMRGRIDGKLDATSLDIPARFVRTLLPNSPIANWLQVAAPALAPASLTAVVTAPAEGTPTGGLQLKLAGSAGGTKVGDLTVITRQPGDWRNGAIDVSGSFQVAASAALVRQVGLAAAKVGQDMPADVTFKARGISAMGLDATAAVNIAGVRTNASGKVSVSPEFVPSFTGTIDLASNNLDPMIALAGLGIPGAAVGTSAKLTGDLTLGPTGASLKWSNATFAGDRASGAVSLTPADRGWKIDGSIDADEVDVGWLLSLGLGFPPTPTGDANVPWSKTPFISPVYGMTSGKLAVTAGAMTVSDQLSVRNAKLGLSFEPQRLDVALTAGDVAGGSVSAGITISNVAGNASVTGRFSLAHAALDSLIWRLDGRAVATGMLDLSANFEASGRSPAGLIAGATGGGVLSVTGGEARYINPAAARALIRASDLGQQYTPDALRLAFADAISGDSLKFDRADGAFMIAGGTVRLNDLALRGAGIEATAGAVVDLNAMSLSSDWTLSFDPGDAKVQGTNPKVGLLFAGPLVTPRRSIDALPLAAYLNLRQQARLLDVIALQDATSQERDRLIRLTKRISEDDAHRVAAAREAADREARRKASVAAAMVALVRLHDGRDVANVRLAVAGLRAYADRLAGDAATAQRAADAARRALDGQKPMVDAAQAALTRAMADERTAVVQADAAATLLASAQAAADKANADAQSVVAAVVPFATPVPSVDPLRLAADNAVKALADRTAADMIARVALVNAQLVRVAAQANLDAANAESARLSEASRNASRDSAAKSQIATTARQVADRAAAGS